MVLNVVPVLKIAFIFRKQTPSPVENIHQIFCDILDIKQHGIFCLLFNLLHKVTIIKLQMLGSLLQEIASSKYTQTWCRYFSNHGNLFCTKRSTTTRIKKHKDVILYILNNLFIWISFSFFFLIRSLEKTSTVSIPPIVPGHLCDNWT